MVVILLFFLIVRLLVWIVVYISLHNVEVLQLVLSLRGLVSALGIVFHLQLGVRRRLRASEVSAVNLHDVGGLQGSWVGSGSFFNFSSTFVLLLIVALLLFFFLFLKNVNLELLLTNVLSFLLLPIFFQYFFWSGPLTKNRAIVNLSPCSYLPFRM